MGIITIFFYFVSAWYFGFRIDRERLSWRFLLLFLLPLFSTQFLGIFHRLTLNSLFVFGLLSVCIGFMWEYRSPSIKKITWDFSYYSFIQLAFFLIVAFFAYRTPVFEIDSLAYHLPITTQFIKTSGIWDVFNAGFVGPNTYFPANHEALQAFLTILTGTLRFNFLVTLLGIFLFTASLRDMSRKTKVHPALIFLSVISIASVPFLFKQLFNLQVDLFLFCLFGSLVATLFFSIISRDRRDVMKAFLLIGFVIGTKYNGIIQVLVLLPIILGVIWHFRNSLRKLWFMPFLAFLTGGLWYIRNWIVTGNPVYPFGINGHRVFLEDLGNSSIMNSIFQEGLRPTFAKIFGNFYFEDLIGRVSLLLIPIVIFCLLKKPNRWIFWGMLIYSFIGEIFAYFLSPNTARYWDATVRYSSAVFALVPITFVFTSMYSKWARRAITIFAVLLLVYNISIKSSFIVDPAREWGDFPEISRHLQILKDDVQKGNTIALAGLTPYGFFEREGFNALYVNIDGCLQCKYPDYRNEKKSVRAFPDKEKWQLALRAQNVNYLMVGRTYYRDGGATLFEERWANEDQRNFTNLLATEKFSLYRVN